MDTSEKQKRKSHPFDRANPISLLLFGYTLGWFRKGFKRDLEENDIYDVAKSCKSETSGDKTENHWSKTPSVMKVLICRFGIQYLVICVITCIWTEITSILNPLGQSRLIAFFTPDQEDITRTQAYQYAAVVVFLKVGSFLVLNNIQVFQVIVGMQMHASLKSLLYRKALKLSPSSTSATNLGNLITLITKDINSVEMNIWLLKDFTTFLMQFCTVAYLMYVKIGNPAFIGLGILFSTLPIQIYLSAKLKDWRLTVQKNSDQRLQRTQETLSAVKIIKMYTWETFFYRKISEARRKEISNMMYVFLANTINTTLGIFVTKVAFCVLILVYVWMGYTTNTELIYYILNLFNSINMQVGITLPMSFSRCAQLYASIQRLNEVLQSEELKRIDEDITETPAVLLKDASFCLGDKYILRGISMNISKPGLTVVTGSVGSGKSSLLKVILKDYPNSEGHVEILGSISYASQDPWLFPATIRQNILFGEEFDESRYEEVVKVCALIYDLSLLDDGDQTLVADKGMNLSKGQQARINLARAIYRQADIYLLDDSLTALDNHVQDYIFKECLLKFLKDKICILVSQNSLHIEKAKLVTVLKDGKSVFSGSSKSVDREIIKEITTKTIEETEPKDDANSYEKKLSILSTEEQESKKNVYKEQKQIGKVSLNIYRQYFSYGGGFLIIVFIILLYIGTQYCDSGGDEMLTQWVDFQQKVLDLEEKSITNGTEYEKAVYDKNHAFTIYGIYAGMGSFVGVIAFYSLMRFCQRASIVLHKKMLKALMGATMAFFDSHYIGNILNRFSYDLNNIDEIIPFLFPVLGNTIFGAAGCLILITSVNWFFLLPSLVFLGMMVLLRYLLMPTARSLKRLEAATRSPLVGHINSSLEGLTTIRAFRAEQILKDEFDKHQDLYTSAFMTLRVSMNAVAFFMDVFNTIFTLVVIGRFLFFEISTTAGNVGLALTQVFRLTSLIEMSIKIWTDIENSMTSVERAAEYCNVKQEPTEGELIENWPSKGAINFDKVTLCYEGSRTPVLKNITFDVNPQEKIGIVGRTGAGKSSIITVLFRLYDFEGKVEIDGVDTKALSMEFMRKNIAIIPQDPVLFTGTVRENIDPFNNYSDDVIWDVIEKVGIKEIVPTLDTFIENSGANYSSGQKQLVCLARAAISKCKILVLDEATANMDDETEIMLNKVIDEIFSDCTVLAIAHRLHSIMKSDRILVLDRGRIVEYDNPKVLMERKDGLFYKMCQDSKLKI